MHLARCRYIGLLDDDVFFTSSTRLELLLDQLELHPEVDIAAGAYAQYDSKAASMYVHDYSLLFGASTTEEGAWYAYTPTPPTPGECYPVNGAHNFFLARTDALRRHPWHPKLSIFEHEHFFFQFYLAKRKVLSCPHVSVFHYRYAKRHLEPHCAPPCAQSLSSRAYRRVLTHHCCGGCTLAARPICTTRST
jgi:hypothetical protein